MFNISIKLFTMLLVIHKEERKKRSKKRKKKSTTTTISKVSFYYDATGRTRGVEKSHIYLIKINFVTLS